MTPTQESTLNFGLDVAPPSLHPVITLFSPKHCEGDAGFSNQNRFKPVMSRKEKKRKSSSGVRDLDPQRVRVTAVEDRVGLTD